MKAQLLLLCIALLGIQAKSQFTETTRFVTTDRTANSELGIDVNLDGNFVISGAYRNSFDANGANPIDEAGAAYIFENNGSGTWTQVQKLVANDRELFAAFGISTAISGNYAVVGAQLEDKDENGANPINNAGAAYIFERDGSGTWSQVQKIVSSTRVAAGSFGISVKIEGNTILVGSHFDATDEDGNNSLPQAGAVFVFERDGSGTWIETQKIVASDRGSGDNFGIDVAMDGDFAVIGAYFDSQDAMGASVSASGTAYVFERDGSGNWNQVQKIVGSDRTMNDRYGEDVAIQGDILAIGARLHDLDSAGGNPVTDAGAVYMYVQDGSGVWNEVKKIVAGDRAETDVFGFSVSVDNGYVAVGARLNDFDASGGNFLPNAGAAYLFEQNTGGSNNWGEIQKIVTSDRSIEDRFAHELVLKNGRLISGSPFQDQDPSGNNDVTNAGMLYVFEDPNLSVLDQENEITLSAFPNPFLEYVTIALGGEPETGKVRVTDMLGHLVYTSTFHNTNYIQLPLEVATGMYIAKLTTARGDIATIKLAKQ